MTRALILLSLLVTTPVVMQAQSPQQTADALITQWQDWMKRHQISEGAIAISQDSKLLAETGINRAPTDPAPIASLSKAITAVCALKALEDAGKTVETRLEAAMPKFFSKHRVKDRRLFQVNVGHLISQDSGIHSDFEQRYRRVPTFEEEQKELQMRFITLDRLGSAPGRSNFHYSNANYLTLGLVIEELTGEPYAEYCARTVLAPLAITTARLNPSWVILSSFGGWEVSARDYLSFLNHYFKDGLILGESPTRFRPKVHIGNNRYYGPGVLFRKTDKGTLIWHAGGWRWKDDTIDDRFGAYFLMLDDGMTISTNFSHDATGGELEELEREIWEITHPN